jgi:hypothetical protein
MTCPDTFHSMPGGELTGGVRPGGAVRPGFV